MNINKENYDMFLMLYLDNELDEKSVEELLLLIENNSKIKEEFELLNKTRITLDEKLKFENKESLYRKRISYKRLSFVFPIAASVLIIFFVWKQNFENNNSIEQSTLVMEEKKVEQNKQIKEEKIEPITKVIVDNRIINKENVAKQNERNNVVNDIIRKNNIVKKENNIELKKEKNIEPQLFVKNKNVEEIVEKNIAINNLNYIDSNQNNITVKNSTLQPIKVEFPENNIEIKKQQKILSITLSENLTEKIDKANGFFYKIKNRINELRNTEIELTINNNYKIKTNN